MRGKVEIDNLIKLKGNNYDPSKLALAELETL